MSVLVVLAAGLFAAPDAAACSCVRPGAACEGYWKASAVFLGRVESVTRQTGKPPSMPGLRRVRFAVIEGFSGVRTGNVEVTTGSGGGDCGFAFRAGVEYVVYASGGEQGAPLRVSICSRTREASSATGDLEYARAVASGAPMAGRISGDVRVGARNLSGPPVSAPRPLAGVGVRLERDGQSTRAVTDADGRFLAQGLPAGLYTASLELPDGLYANGWPRTIDLPDARSCAEVEVLAFPDGRVKGRAVDASGRPIAGLTVELTPPAGLDDSAGPERLRDLTDSQGFYEIAHVPAGRFVVGINTQAARGGATPEPRVFHPGVTSLVGATRVLLKAGERVVLKDLKFPPDLLFVEISGIVLDPDGAPAGNARVFLKGQAEGDYILSEPAIADANGRFSLAAVSGRGYRLFAERAREDSSAGTASSEQAAFTAATAVSPLTLTLRRRY